MLHPVTLIERTFVAFRATRYAYFHVAIWVPFLLHAGYSIADAFLIEAIYYISRCVTILPAGYLSDRFDRVTVLVSASIATGCSFAFVFFEPGFLSLATCQVILGFTMNVSGGSESALLYDLVDAHGARSRYRDIEAKTWVSRTVAWGLAACAGSVVAATFGASVPFLLTGICVLVSAAILHVAGKSLRATARPSGEDARRSLSIAGFAAGIRSISTSPVYVHAVIVYATMFCVVRLGLALFQPALLELGVDLIWFGPLFGLTYAATVACGMYTERLSTDVAVLTRSFCIAAAAFLSLLIAALALSGMAAVLTVILAYCFHAFLQGTFEPVIRDWVNAVAEGSSRGSALTVMPFVGNVAFAVLAPFIGYLIMGIGLKWLLGFALLALLVSFVSIFHATVRHAG